MNYHMIRTDDMLNGSGLRVIVFLSGCNHYCNGCHNPETWDKDSGQLFTKESSDKIMNELDKDYIAGITFSGGDPLNENNLEDVLLLIKNIKSNYPNKNIWLYTGFTWEELNPYILHKGISENDIKHNLRTNIIGMCDVLVDGVFKKDLANVNYPWAGSTNQRVINIQKSLESNKVIYYENN